MEHATIPEQPKREPLFLPARTFPAAVRRIASPTSYYPILEELYGRIGEESKQKGFQADFPLFSLLLVGSEDFRVVAPFAYAVSEETNNMIEQVTSEEAVNLTLGAAYSLIIDAPPLDQLDSTISQARAEIEKHVAQSAEYALDTTQPWREVFYTQEVPAQTQGAQQAVNGKWYKLNHMGIEMPVKKRNGV